MVQRRDRRAGEEPGLTVVDDMQLIVLFVPTDEACKEEVIWVC